MRLRISEPHITPREITSVMRCLEEGELTQNGGSRVGAFELRLARELEVGYAVACSSGTTALHLALRALEPKPAVVIVPALTYVATAAAVRYIDARIRFVDVDDTWTMNTDDLMRVIVEERENEMAVLPVHLYGVCANMSTIQQVTALRNRFIPVIEDASQALFSTHHHEYAGTMGDMGTFSFYANKLITSGGEGGAVVTNAHHLAELVQFFRGQAQSPTQRYWHTEVGFNYRITAMQMAFGLEQLKFVDDVIIKRRTVADVYRQAFTDRFDTQRVPEECKQIDWLYTLLVPHGIHRDDVMTRLDEEFDIETRPVFPSVASMPPYRTHDPLPVTTDVAARGISLPTHAEMSTDDAARVVEAFITCVGD